MRGRDGALHCCLPTSQPKQWLQRCSGVEQTMQAVRAGTAGRHGTSAQQQDTLVYVQNNSLLPNRFISKPFHFKAVSFQSRFTVTDTTKVERHSS